MTSDPFRGLAQSSSARLERILREARAPALEALVRFEWRGYNVPWAAQLLGIRKFVKGFFEAREPGCVEGYNIPVRQNGLERPWLQLPSQQNPRRYAFFDVLPPGQEPRERAYPQAALLDYGASARNPSFGVERTLRDYLVQPDPGNPDLLLGKAYGAIGSLRVPIGFFVLERLGPTTWKPAP